MDVKLANPLKVKLIAESTIKTDTVDAITLAQLERTNFLPLSYLPSKEIREQRELLRHRFTLVNIRKSLKNKPTRFSRKGASFRLLLTSLEQPGENFFLLWNFLLCIARNWIPTLI